MTLYKEITNMFGLNLTNGYYIEIDGMRNYTLKKHRVGQDKDGQPREYNQIIGYYANLENALKLGYLRGLESDILSSPNSKVNELTLYDIDDYLSRLEEIESNVIAMFTELVKKNEVLREEIEKDE